MPIGRTAKTDSMVVDKNLGQAYKTVEEVKSKLEEIITLAGMSDALQAIYDNLDQLLVDPEKGDSAYQVAVNNGFIGTELDWVFSLKGDRGDDGIGIATINVNEVGQMIIQFTNGGVVNLGNVRGANGVWISGAEVLLNGTLNLTLSDGSVINAGSVRGARGETGRSAYEEAVLDGFSGTETQWLASLKGTKGDDGRDAYEVAVDGGFSGTRGEWLLTLRGPAGDNAYTLAQLEGFVGTRAEWIESLKGDKGEKGDDGDDNYQIAVRNGFVGTEQDWLDSLAVEGQPGPAGPGFVSGVIYHLNRDFYEANQEEFLETNGGVFIRSAHPNVEGFYPPGPRQTIGNLDQSLSGSSVAYGVVYFQGKFRAARRSTNSGSFATTILESVTGDFGSWTSVTQSGANFGYTSSGSGIATEASDSSWLIANISNSFITRTTDGTTFVQISPVTALSAIGIKDIIYKNGIYVIYGTANTSGNTTGIWISVDDGATFNRVTPPAEMNALTMFVFWSEFYECWYVGTAENMWKTPSLIDPEWTECSINGYDQSIRAGEEINGLVVAYADAGRFYTSNDGIVFNAGVFATGITSPINAVKTNGGLVVFNRTISSTIVDGYNEILATEDGINYKSLFYTGNTAPGNIVKGFYEGNRLGVIDSLSSGGVFMSPGVQLVSSSQFRVPNIRPLDAETNFYIKR